MTEQSNLPVLSNAAALAEHCAATKSNGEPCKAKAGSGGFCIGHRPGAAEARSRGGTGRSTANRAEKMLPAKLRPLARELEEAYREVHDGKLDHRKGAAMATMLRALIAAYVAGEFEERLRRLESNEGIVRK